MIQATSEFTVNICNDFEVLYQYIRHWILSQVYLLYSINISESGSALLQVILLNFTRSFLLFLWILFSKVRIEAVNVDYYISVAEDQ
jgi:hypothetical protein